jgi:hypothetical protein
VGKSITANGLGGKGGSSGAILGGTVTYPTDTDGGRNCLSSMPQCLTGRNLSSLPCYGGAGGAGGDGSGSGAGGAGGGICIVIARTIKVKGSASICANGGKGSNAVTAGYGGGGGGGGCVILVSSTKISKLNLTVTASGGLGGTGRRGSIDLINLINGGTGMSGEDGLVVTLLH